MSTMWDYRDSAWTDGFDLAGYDVEATDGRSATSTGHQRGVQRLPGRRHRLLDLRQEAGDPPRRDLLGRARRQDGPGGHDQGPDQGRPRLRRRDWNDESRTQQGDYYRAYQQY